MAIVTTTSAKAYFDTGDKPTQAQFVDLIDTTSRIAGLNYTKDLGGLVNVSADNAAAFDAAVSAAQANDLPLFLSEGTYEFRTKPSRIEGTVKIIGNTPNVVLERKYAPATEDEPFIDLASEAGVLENVTLIANGDSGGRALQIVATSAGDSSLTPDWNYVRNVRIWATAATWNTGIYVNGSARPSGTGSRDNRFDNCFVFDCSANNVYWDHVVSPVWTGGGIFQGTASGATNNFTVTGTSALSNQKITIGGTTISGTLDVSATTGGNIHGIIDTALTLGASAKNITATVGNAPTITRTSGNTVIVGDKIQAGALLEASRLAFKGGSNANIEVSGNVSINFYRNDAVVLGLTGPGTTADQYMQIRANTSAASGPQLEIAGSAVGNKNLLLAPGSAGTVDAVYQGFSVSGVQVVGSRETGFAAPTGTSDSTTFNADSPTNQELGQYLKALVSALTSHGIIGT